MNKYLIFSFFIFFYSTNLQISQIEGYLGEYKPNCGCPTGTICCPNSVMKENFGEEKFSDR